MSNEIKNNPLTTETFMSWWKIGKALCFRNTQRNTSDADTQLNYERSINLNQIYKSNEKHKFSHFPTKFSPFYSVLAVEKPI